MSSKTSGKKAPACSRLTVLSGARRCVILLDQPRIKLGRQTAAGKTPVFGLDNENVSREHVLLETDEAGNTLIQDLDSLNKTRVNGEELAPHRIRKLQHRDLIELYDVRVRYNDVRRNPNPGMLIAQLFLVVCLLVAMFWVFRVYEDTRPDVKAVLDQAKVQIAAGDFAAAEQTVQRARQARGARENFASIERLNKRLRLYQVTSSQWQDMLNQLTAHRLNQLHESELMHELGRLSTDQAAWNWNAEGIAAYERSRYLRDRLGLLQEARNLLGSSGDLSKQEREDVEQKMATLAAVGPPADCPPVFGQLNDELNSVRNALRQWASRETRYQRAMNLLVPPEVRYPDFAAVLATLQRLEQEADDRVSARIRRVRGPIATLAQNYQQMQDMARQAMNLQSITHEIEFLPESRSSVDERIGKARDFLEHNHRVLLDDVAALQARLRAIDELTSTHTQPAEWLRSLSNRSFRQAIYRPDILDHARPRRTRDQRAGSYDAALGMEEFYQFVREPDRETTRTAHEVLPPPMVRMLRDYMQQVVALQDWMQKRAYLNHHAIARRMTELHNQRRSYHNVIQTIAREHRAFGQNQYRARLIAAGMLLQLMTPDLTHDRQRVVEELRASMLADYKAIKARLNRLMLDMDDYLVPEKQVRARGEILRLGLPGEAAVSRAWASRDANRERTTD